MSLKLVTYWLHAGDMRELVMLYRNGSDIDGLYDCLMKHLKYQSVLK